jgi:hypothetical protein
MNLSERVIVLEIQAEHFGEWSGGGKEDLQKTCILYMSLSTSAFGLSTLQISSKNKKSNVF